LVPKCSSHRDESFALFIFILRILELEIKLSVRRVKEERLVNEEGEVIEEERGYFYRWIFFSPWPQILVIHEKSFYSGAIAERLRPTRTTRPAQCYVFGYVYV